MYRLRSLIRTRLPGAFLITSLPKLITCVFSIKLLILMILILIDMYVPLLSIVQTKNKNKTTTTTKTRTSSFSFVVVYRLSCRLNDFRVTKTLFCGKIE